MKKNFFIFLILSTSIFAATLKSQPVIHSPDYMSFEINAKSYDDAENLAEEVLETPLNVTYKNKYGTWWYYCQSKKIIVTITKEDDSYVVEVEKGSFDDFNGQITADKRYY